MMGAGGSVEDQFSKLEEAKHSIEQVTRLFKDPVRFDLTPLMAPGRHSCMLSSIEMR